MIEITHANDSARLGSEYPSAHRSVGCYEVLRPIGWGEAASVWLARDRHHDREVALKEVTALRSIDRSKVQRFLQESRRAGPMSHPNIVTVYDRLEADGAPCIAMEYLPRGSLRRYCGRLAPAQIVGVLEGVLSGLAHAEVRGVVHRDLKPENILITADGRVKIADFGIVTAVQAVCTWAGIGATVTAIGTKAYMPPEQTAGHPVGPWTDLYAVGVIAHEMLVGRLPSQDLPLTAAQPALRRWMQDLLAPDPHRRISSAYVAWDSLEEVAIDLWGPRWRRDARVTADRQR